MNVTQLKALAKDLGIKGYSKLNKADLLAVTSGQMEALHNEAIVMDDMREKANRNAMMTEPGLLAAEADYNFQNSFKGLTIHQRLATYRAQNGSNNITPKQRRRIMQKMNRDFKRGYSLETVVGKVA